MKGLVRLLRLLRPGKLDSFDLAQAEGDVASQLIDEDDEGAEVNRPSGDVSVPNSPVSSRTAAVSDSAFANDDGSRRMSAIVDDDLGWDSKNISRLEHSTIMNCGNLIRCKTHLNFLNFSPSDLCMLHSLEMLYIQPNQDGEDIDPPEPFLLDRDRDSALGSQHSVASARLQSSTLSSVSSSGLRRY